MRSLGVYTLPCAIFVGGPHQKTLFLTPNDSPNLDRQSVAGNEKSTKHSRTQARNQGPLVIAVEFSFVFKMQFICEVYVMEKLWKMIIVSRTLQASQTLHLDIKC